MSLSTYSVPITAREQAMILQRAAALVHERLDRIPTRAEASDDEWRRYVDQRRQAALDVAARLVVARFLGVENVPAWLDVRGATGHYQNLRLDFTDLGLAPCLGLVTLGPDGGRFAGFAPLYWVADAALDPRHAYLAIHPHGETGVTIPADHLLEPAFLLENLEAIAAGELDLPRPSAPPPLPAVSRVEPEPMAEPIEDLVEVAPEVPPEEVGMADDANHSEPTPGLPFAVPDGMSREAVLANLNAFLAVNPGEVAFAMGDGTFARREAFERSLTEGRLSIPLQQIKEAGELTGRATEIEATPGEMARGVLRSAGQLLTGGMASTEVREARWATCQGCPFLTPDDRCSKCGCYMKAKVAIGQAECPAGRWAQ